MNNSQQLVYQSQNLNATQQNQQFINNEQEIQQKYAQNLQYSLHNVQRQSVPLSRSEFLSLQMCELHIKESICYICTIPYCKQNIFFCRLCVKEKTHHTHYDEHQTDIILLDQFFEKLKIQNKSQILKEVDTKQIIGNIGEDIKNIAFYSENHYQQYELFLDQQKYLVSEEIDKLIQKFSQQCLNLRQNVFYAIEVNKQQMKNRLNEYSNTVYDTFNIFNQSHQQPLKFLEQKIINCSKTGFKSMKEHFIRVRDYHLSKQLTKTEFEYKQQEIQQETQKLTHDLTQPPSYDLNKIDQYTDQIKQIDKWFDYFEEIQLKYIFKNEKKDFLEIQKLISEFKQQQSCQQQTNNSNLSNSNLNKINNQLNQNGIKQQSQQQEQQNAQLKQNTLSSNNKSLLLVNWDINQVQFSQKPQLLHTTHAVKINCICSISDQIVATCGREPLIILWDINTLKQIKQLKGHQGEIVVLSVFTKTLSGGVSKKYLISGSKDKSMFIWDLEDETNSFVLKNPKGVITNILDLQDGKNIIVNSSERKLVIWDLQKNERKFEKQSGFINKLLKLSQQNRFATSEFFSGFIIIWKIEYEGQHNIKQITQERALQACYNLTSINSLLLQSNIIIGSTQEQQIRIFDLNQQLDSSVKTIQIHESLIIDTVIIESESYNYFILSFSQKDKKIAICSSSDNFENVQYIHYHGSELENEDATTEPLMQIAAVGNGQYKLLLVNRNQLDPHILIWDLKFN